jgi:HAD superfamily hydrolase (TIGR01509 family)
MTVDAVIFDLGGVLVEYRGVAPLKALSGIQDDQELWRRWLSCEWVRRFERGQCLPEEFAGGVVADWALAVTPDAFLAQFRNWVHGSIPGADALVAAVRAEVPVACLSNTNSVHWRYGASRWSFVDLLDRTFLSFQLGMVKPDREIFDHVSRQLGAPGRRLLFLDDNTVNVEAAIDAGWTAVKVDGVNQARRALVHRGVLAS